MGRRSIALVATTVALGLLVTGCGRLPTTPSLADAGGDAPAGVPAACLDEGLAVALGSGVYAVPLTGSLHALADLPARETAVLQDAGSARAGGLVTLCVYVADHPSPFSTHGGEDAIVCVAVDADGQATVLGTRLGARAEAAAACGPAGVG